MKGYFSYFKRSLISGLQYRLAALSGLVTAYFWGFIFASIYINFYNNNSVSDINLQELISYVWLNQIFYSLLNLAGKDPFIMNSIKSGEVSYELVRPNHLYVWWYIKLLANKYSMMLLRMIPIAVVAFILPAPFNLGLPYSLESFLLFLVALFLGSLLVVSIGMLIITISFFSNEDKGISSFVIAFGSIFSGLIVPLPLLPKIFNDISDLLPFRYMNDTIFRIYSGNISVNDSIGQIFIQLGWIFILVFTGLLLMRKALTKVSVQGG